MASTLIFDRWRHLARRPGCARDWPWVSPPDWINSCYYLQKVVELKSASDQGVADHFINGRSFSLLFNKKFI